MGTNPFRFTGRETDGTGLSYHGARYLSPALSRWLSEDPIGFAGGTTSLGQYALDDPVDWVDLDGIDPKEPPPNDCGLGCTLLKRIFNKTANDAAKNFPDMTPPTAKDAWKPGPR